MTQCERVLDYMQRFGSITSAEAVMDLGVYRLAARVSDLRKEGHKISDRMESGKNRFGEKTSYKRYSLED